MKRIWKLIVALIAFVVVAGAAGAAYAFWSTGGTGSGVATTGDLESVTILSATAGEVVGSKLYPGGTANVVLKVSNPNAYAVQVVSIEQVDDSDITGSGSCDTTGVTFTAPVSVPDIDPGTNTIVLTNAASMDTSSDDDCQGATFDIPVTLTVKA
jgi:hypothetical protein